MLQLDDRFVVSRGVLGFRFGKRRHQLDMYVASPQRCTRAVPGDHNDDDNCRLVRYQSHRLVYVRLFDTPVRPTIARVVCSLLLFVYVDTTRLTATLVSLSRLTTSEAVFTVETNNCCRQMLFVASLSCSAICCSRLLCRLPIEDWINWSLSPFWTTPCRRGRRTGCESGAGILLAHERLHPGDTLECVHRVRLTALCT